MTQRAMFLYLLNGYPVGLIARELGQSRASIRALLKSGGVTIRPTSGGYLRGRDQVCEAVRRAGYDSFHTFARSNSLVPTSEQADLLGVTERSLGKIYVSYKSLLEGLMAAGIALPTNQRGNYVER